ncbi:MAG TPA: HEAT repeat domain-containing protein [Isosphaeraceae bacterium]|jgi:hypothetical protein|nr:HEAT repeat domain-containing protein [Isosphaeraceae bacterium]
MAIRREAARSWLVALTVLSLAPAARADRIILRGGGQVHGVIVADTKQPDKVLVQTDAAKPLTFRKEQVVRVDREPGPLDEYPDRRTRAKAEASSQYELGMWCEAKRLKGLAEHHYRQAVALDPNYSPAHKKLGHVEFNGRWMTVEEMKTAQGMVKSHGKWITREVKDRQDARDALTANQQSWARRLRVFRLKLMSDVDADRRSAESDLSTIRDPAAVAALVQVFGRDPTALRQWMLQSLVGIPGTDATAALTKLLIWDPEPKIRQGAMDEVKRRKERGVVSYLIRTLKDENPEIVGRAAWALSNLNETSAVPELVKVLVTVRERVEVVPTLVPAGAGGGIGGGFVGGPGGSGVSLGGFSSYSGRSIGFPTGVAMAPGAVAFGGASVPFTAIGGGGGGMQVAPQPQVVYDVLRNGLVLQALQKLTGKDYGYDVDAWRRWVDTSFRAREDAARRVRQP